MILRLTLFLLTALSPTLAADNLFYIGCFGGKGIYAGRLDTATGKLGPITTAAEANDPSVLTFSPDKKTLYAAVTAPPGNVAAYRAEGDRLTLLNEKSSGGQVPIFVSTDVTGSHVFATNYVGGNLICLQAKADGSLGEQTAEFTFPAPADPEGKKKAHAHAAYIDPANRFLYVCDLGANHIWTFRFDPAKGSLTLVEPQTGEVPAGSGPRHLAWHPNGKFVYAANETAVTATAFARNAESGALMPLQTLSTVPEGTERKKLSASEIACHPSGRWLYVSNRGANTIAVFQIGDDGKLTKVQDAPAQVIVPTGFAIDPTGQWLLVAGQKDSRVAVLKIDAATGQLTATDQSAEVPTPVSVMFAK